MVIKRDIYLNRLISRMNNGMIKVVTGIRRCGKSFLLFKLFIDHLRSQGIPDKQIVQIPLDNETYASYRNPDKLYKYIASNITDEKKTVLCPYRRGSICHFQD